MLHCTTCEVLCRWLGWSKAIRQPVPCLNNGVAVQVRTTGTTSRPGSATPEQEEPINRTPHMPAGYIEEDTGKQGTRKGWTHVTDTPAHTWLYDNILKWTGLELLARYKTAQFLLDQIYNPTMKVLTALDIRGRQKYVEERIKVLGLRGLPVFHKLSYFKYACCDLCWPTGVAESP